MNEDVELCNKVLEKLSEAKKKVGKEKVEVKISLDYEELNRLQDLLFSTRELAKC